MDDAIQTELPAADPPAGERYLLLADISGYTGFMAGVEREHGADFSAGVPAAYSVLGALLDSVIVGLGPAIALVKLEGDAVCAAASAPGQDRQGQPRGPSGSLDQGNDGFRPALGRRIRPSVPCSGQGTGHRR